MKLLDWTSLRTRITLGMLLAVLLTVWLITLLASRVLRDEMESAISAQQFSAVALVAKNIDQSLSDRISAINELADRLSRSRTPLGQQQRFLEGLVALPRMFNWGVFIIDSEGIARASIPTHLNRIGTDYREIPVIQKVFEQGQTLVTDPLIGKKTNQPLVSVIAPIRDLTGKIQGLVLGVTNLAEPNFLDSVNTAKYGVTGDFFVIAPESRRYVASSDKRRVMTVGPPVGINPLYDRYLEGQEGSGVAMSSRGVLTLSSCKRIPSVNWVMASVLPAEEAFAPIASMQRSLLLGALILTMLVSWVTWWWLRRQFRPLSEVSDLLTSMRGGLQTRQPLPVRRDDEIGQLVLAINGLLRRIVDEEERAVEYAADERLRKIVSHVPGVVFQFRMFPDGSACFPFASEGLTKIYGVLPEDVRENIDPIREMAHPEDRERFFSSLQDSTSSLTLWRVDYRICRPDGVIKWLLVEAMPEQEDGGVTWYGSISDITDAKAQEAELRIAATTFLSHEGIMITDTRHVILRVNPAFTEITGYEADEVIGRNPDIIRSKCHEEHFHQTVQEELRVKGIWQGEIIGQRKNGDKFSGWLTINAVRDEQGVTTHYVSMIQDITERKAAEETLRFTQFVVEKTSDQALWTTEDGDIVYVNDAACHSLEYTREELLKLSIQDICPKLFSDKYAQYWREIKEKGTIIFESLHQSKSGLVITVEVRGNYLIFNGKEYSCVFATDITERIKAEKEKSRLQAQLYQAQKMEAIGTLAGGIAHDFNNILSVIFGYSELAKKDAPPGSRYQDNMQKVLIAADRAKGLVNQILAFSRQTDVKRMPLKIQPLISEGLKMLRSSIPTTISITEKIDPECGVIFADPTQIHQILMNLCTNAYHAMEATGGVLAVSLKTAFIHRDDQKMLLHLSPGEYVEVTVSDTGPGIEPDIMERIFDPYFTTKERGKGTGMGLAIIHGIIKEYGGAITVESNKGEGAAFHVYFPVVNKDVDKDAEAEVTGTENPPMGTERILMIDDEELLAEMGKDILERLGYQVTVQLSSIEALALFQNQPNEFDMVITDQTMPGMTGADLAQRMLQIRPDVPVILCTGYSNVIDEQSAKALGIREFALKPLSRELLARLIRNVLDAK